MVASYVDFALVGGMILAVASLIPIVSGMLDGERPFVPLVMGMVGLGLLAYAFQHHRFDITLTEIVDAFRRVYGNLVRHLT